MRLPSPSAAAYTLVAGISIVSLLHLARPIDLSGDSICYLLQAQGILGYDAPTGWSRETECPYPSGYPSLLAILIRMGAAISTASVLVNLACIGVGLLLLQRAAALVMDMPTSWSIWAVLATINSFVIVRGMTLVLSEPIFLFVESLSLFFLATASIHTKTRQRAEMIVALATVLCAMLTRTIGVALLVPLCWLAVREIRRKNLQTRVTTNAVIGAGTVAGVAAALYSRDYYLNVDFGSNYARGAFGTFLTSLQSHFREIGEIVLNVPPSKVPAGLRPSIALLGVIISIGVTFLLWVRRERWTVFEPYLVAYAAIIFLWPFYDTRFWFPVIPVIAIVALDEIRARNALSARGARLALTTFGLYFLTSGVVVHAFNIRRSMNPDFLTQQYSGDPTDQSILAGLGHSTSIQVDSSVVRMLRSIRQ